MARILIVDDRAVNRQFLATLLGYAGHELLEASNGVEALERVRRERPDLVITDILMPTMNGYEFVQTLRADLAIAHTPVIFHTATYSEREAQKLAKASGADAVLRKPCEPEEVFSAVRRALGEDAPPAAQTRPVRALPAAAPTIDESLGLRLQDPHRDAASLQRVASQLSALIEIGMEAAQEHDPERLLELYLSAAQRMLRSEIVAIGVQQDAGEAVERVVASGVDARALSGQGRPGTASLGSLLSERRVLRTSDAAAERLPAGFPEVRSLLALSLVSKEGPFGWILFANQAHADAFSDEDERLAGVLAAEFALRFENARLYDIVQRHAATLQIEVSERRRAQELLMASEARLRLFVEHAPAAIAMLDRDLRYLAVSRRWLADYRLGERDIVGLCHYDVFPEIPERWKEIHRRCLAGAVEQCDEDPFPRADGRLDWVRWEIHPWRSKSDEVSGLIMFSEVITERREARARIQRLNRVYAVLSGINGALVRFHDRDELFREACRIAVESGGFKAAWIGVVHREAGRIEPVAWRGADDEYMRGLPLGLGGGGGGALDERSGLAALAVNERKAVVVNDMTADARIANREAARHRGYRSLAVLPLVLSGEAIGVLSLHAGETDFFDAGEMKLLVQLAGDIAFALDHIAQSERLDYLAYYDQLTGLANRNLFADRLHQYVQTASATGGKLALVLADVERLSAVNASIGRQGGDALLKEVAARLLKGGDTAEIARLGADQFAVVLRDVRGRSEVGRRIAAIWQEVLGVPFALAGAELRVSMRSGTVLFPQDGADAGTLLKNAEAALRNAKHTGERHVFHSHEMTLHIAENLSLETSLRQALEKKEFVLHYQPKVDLDAARIVGLEALIRWQSPERGLVPPMKFIPLMEETGMILEAGAWALERAALDHRRWSEAGLSPPRVAVNVSAIQLRQRGFVAAVERAIAGGILPTGIDLEITESLIMEDVKGSIEKLKSARALGMSIAIDDFGTGYSSLGYLAKLPVQTLKIDRSFIITMLDDPDTMTLVSTIVSLAHSLRLKVVAEGVDDKQQAKILRLLRCDEIQGFLICRPLPFDEMTALLGRGGTIEMPLSS